MITVIKRMEKKRLEKKKEEGTDGRKGSRTSKTREIERGEERRIQGDANERKREKEERGARRRKENKRVEDKGEKSRK